MVSTLVCILKRGGGHESGQHGTRQPDRRQSERRKLRKLLGTRSDSGTVRAAVEHRLASLQALNALRRLQAIGKLEDVFSRDVRTQG
jgi:hypothetical protein